MTGYGSQAYMESLAEFGQPVHLPLCGGSILVRTIPGYPGERDAIGGYPLFSCGDWSKLGSDLDQLDSDIVSLGLVADPHGNFDESLLHECFDVVVPFKQHYLVDLDGNADGPGTAGRREKSRRALRSIDVEVCHDPGSFLDEWCGLYEVLVSRHGITGVRAFSRTAFEQQLALPGIVVFKALHAGELVGALIVLCHGGVAYGHLCALNEPGYALHATYALDWVSFEYFAGKVRCVDLGGGLSMGNAAEDGLTEYKKGWATRTVPVHFCGRILNPGKYESISAEKGLLGKTTFFPAYRAGEYS